MATLRDLREAKGLTALELAILIDATPGSVYNWEKGEREPKTRYLMPLGRILGVTTDEVIAAIEESAAQGKAVA